MFIIVCSFLCVDPVFFLGGGLVGVLMLPASHRSTALGSAHQSKRQTHKAAVSSIFEQMEADVYRRSLDRLFSSNE